MIRLPGECYEGASSALDRILEKLPAGEEGPLGVPGVCVVALGVGVSEVGVVDGAAAGVFLEGGRVGEELGCLVNGLGEW